MNVQETQAEQSFRASVREWMAVNLRGPFEPLRHASGLGSPGYTVDATCPWHSR